MSVQGSSNDLIMPKLSRVQLTDFGSVFVILSHGDDASAVGTGSNGGAKHRGGVGVGGSLQAFLYDKASELWLRMADSRFALSDFFTTVPSTDQKSSFLAKAEDSVKFGSVQSTLKSSRTRNGDRNASLIYDQLEDDSGSFIATRSHCEDRMACALALNAPEDFQEWLVCYTRTISRRGMESQLRHLLDLLLGRVGSELIEHEDCQLGWWLSYSPDILGLDRRGLVKNMLLPEIGKNRALQRIVADVSMQLQSL
jgi:protein HIRA/HIR1